MQPPQAASPRADASLQCPSSHIFRPKHPLSHLRVPGWNPWPRAPVLRQLRIPGIRSHSKWGLGIGPGGLMKYGSSQSWAWWGRPHFLCHVLLHANQLQCALYKHIMRALTGGRGEVGCQGKTGDNKITGDLFL